MSLPVVLDPETSGSNQTPGAPGVVQVLDDIFYEIGFTIINRKQPVTATVLHSPSSQRLVVMGVQYIDPENYKEIRMYEKLILKVDPTRMKLIPYSMGKLLKRIRVHELVRKADGLRMNEELLKIYLLQDNNIVTREIRSHLASGNIEHLAIGMAYIVALRFSVLETLLEDYGLTVTSVLGLTYLVDEYAIASPAALLAGIPAGVVTKPILGIVVKMQEGSQFATIYRHVIRPGMEFVSRIITTSTDLFANIIEQARNELGLRTKATVDLINALARLAPGLIQSTAPIEEKPSKAETEEKPSEQSEEPGRPVKLDL